MSRIITEVCQSCQPCLNWTISKRAHAPLRTNTAFLPWDTLGVDLVTSFDPAPDGSAVILVVTDMFTSYTLLRPLPDRQAPTVAKALWQIMSDFGMPQILHSDSDPSFINTIVTELLAKIT